ncbi:MAG: methyltransferase domain-containing protein [bacterium]
MSNQKENTATSHFTGERFIPGETDPILALEHYHRYAFAEQFVKGKRVLDIACGEGYGAAHIAPFVEMVVGIDKDAQTIERANDRYQSIQNLKFIVGDCESFSMDEKFDIVLSFETIEHLDLPSLKLFLQNVRQILHENGSLVISTPERDEYNKYRTAPNEYHQHEFTREEFQSLLQEHFKIVRLFAQKPIISSMLWNLRSWKDRAFEFIVRDGLEDVIDRPERFVEPLYLIALCTNANIPPDRNVQNSLYFDISAESKQTSLAQQLRALEIEFEDRSAWAKKLDSIVQERDKTIQELRKAYDESMDWAVRLDVMVKERDGIIARLNQAFEERTEWAKRLEVLVKERDGIIAGLNQAFEERTKWAKNLEAMVKEREGIIAGLNQAFEERTKWAKNLEVLVKERDSIITGLNQAFEERTVWAKNLEAMVTDRDILITSLQRSFEEKSQWANSLDFIVKEKTEWIVKLEREIQELALLNHSLDGRIQNITSSYIFRALLFLGLLKRY